MTHLSIETLSTYLDNELSSSRRLLADRHLEACSACRSRLDGLHRVVSTLSMIEPEMAPAHLKSEVQRFADLQSVGTSVRVRLERLAALTRQQPPLLAAFGVVIALTLIIFLLASGLTYFSPTGTELIVAPGSTAAPEVLEVGARTFERTAGVWIERVWPGGEPSRRVTYDSEEFDSYRAREPELAALIGLDQSVWIVLDGEKVELCPEL